MRRAVAILFACLFCGGQAISPVPPEVKFKSRYVNPGAKAPDFHAAMLWGIAIADTRVPGYERAKVEIARVKLRCRVDGKEVVLNDDTGAVRGGLYRRHPWFGSNEHDPMTMEYSMNRVILAVGTRPDKVWHFWAASSRRTIPQGRLEGCSVQVRTRVSPGALLQVGFDYWRNDSVGYGTGGNNREAGASRWYLPSAEWQTAEFSDATGR